MKQYFESIILLQSIYFSTGRGKEIEIVSQETVLAIAIEIDHANAPPTVIKNAIVIEIATVIETARESVIVTATAITTD
jgi:hypothetical protein